MRFFRRLKNFRSPQKRRELWAGLRNYCGMLRRGALLRRLTLRTWWVRRRGGQFPVCCPAEETIAKLCAGASISRFGDGELILTGNVRDIRYQTHSRALARRLREILVSDVPGLLIGIPDWFRPGKQAQAYARPGSHLWSQYHQVGCLWMTYCRHDKIYDSTSISRPGDITDDLSARAAHFRLLKQIWQDRDLVFLEGEKSRLGAGNDLFDNARSVRRILCPAEHAFGRCAEILAAARRAEKTALLLLALGPTATVLAYDLHLEGYQAVDIGHVDIEYEWFLRGGQRVAIPGKYTNEASGGHDPEDLDDPQYESEIWIRV